MNIIAIVNRKGGVGKTATAHALGAGLILSGYRVLFVDLDSQCNLSSGLGADRDAPGSWELMTGDATAAQVIQDTPQGAIIAGSDALAGADSAIDGTGREYRLKEALDGLNYDYCIVDTPAALGVLTVNALTAAESIVIPVQADIDSLQGLVMINQAIGSVKKYCNPGLYIRGILITRYSGRSNLSKDIRESLEDAAAQLNTQLYSTPIRECVSIREAKANKQDIYHYAPRSNAAKDYRDFVYDFLKR